jgi:hypothetical protein
MLGNSHRHPQGRQSKEVQRQSICDLIFTLPRRQG